MSTKIYNGLRYKGTYRSLLEKLNLYRAEKERKAHNMVYLMLLHQPATSERWDKAKSLYDDYRKNDDSGMTLKDIFGDVTVSIFPDSKFIYLIPHGYAGTTGRFHSRMLKEEGFLDYGYWDNADMPEGVSCKAWDAREDKWNKLMGGDGWTPPSECSFSWQAFVESAWYRRIDPSMAISQIDRARQKRIAGEG